MQYSGGILVSIVTFNSGPALARCLYALKRQKGYSEGRIRIVVIDNASTESPAELVFAAGPDIQFIENKQNLGFCGAHNQAVKIFLQSNREFLVTVNPDLALDENALEELALVLVRTDQAGSACPKLYRADSELKPLLPLMLDACGMYITPALRHLDIGSGELEQDSYNAQAFVFGGSGACLMMKRRFVEDMILSGVESESLYTVYPQLGFNTAQRVQLFDEAFFAYREDADLAWRAQLLGWRCVYVPKAVGYHQRLVLPERRAQLSTELNRLGVRNRFLLQLNNYSLALGIRCFVRGFIWRNLLVILGVILSERTSLGALKETIILARRALRRRALIFSRRKITSRELAKWFSDTPYYETHYGSTK